VKNEVRGGRTRKTALTRILPSKADHTKTLVLKLDESGELNAVGNIEGKREREKERKEEEEEEEEEEGRERKREEGGGQDCAIRWAGEGLLEPDCRAQSDEEGR